MKRGPWPSFGISSMINSIREGGILPKLRDIWGEYRRNWMSAAQFIAKQLRSCVARTLFCCWDQSAHFKGSYTWMLCQKKKKKIVDFRHLRAFIA